MGRKAILVALAAVVAATAGAREMTWVYVVPAAANTAGDGGTDWHTDLTLYNPHGTELPILIQFLPSGRNNAGGVPSVTVTVASYETVNLWDVLGPNGFDARGTTGALLVYPDLDSSACADHACDFALFSRTYTPNRDATGEFGQGIPGFPANLGTDWSVMGYLPQLLSNEQFRTNIGLASWTSSGVMVRVDVQDPSGTVVDRSDHWVPPYGHVQWRMGTAVEGGTAVAYVVDGPNDAIVYPYASVVNWDTGDPTYVEAQNSGVELTGMSVDRRVGAKSLATPSTAPRRVAVPGFSAERLRTRTR